MDVNHSDKNQLILKKRKNAGAEDAEKKRKVEA